MKIQRIAILAAILGCSYLSAPLAQEKPTSSPNETTSDQATAEVPERTLEERVVFLLSGYEYFPTRADLDSVGSAKKISALLRELAEDSDRRPTLRLRSVDALGYYDDEATVKLLERLATTSPADGLSRRELRTAGLLRHHAITALAKSQGAKASGVLATLLESDDVQIQLTAIHAMAKHAGEPGRAELEQLHEKTENAIIKRELHKWVD